MGSAYETLDELVREFMLFRGFTSALKAFDADLRAGKEKAFRADRILDQVLLLIQHHDLQSLRDLWSHLEGKLFCRLDPNQANAATKLEASLLKLFLVNCIQTKHHDKVKEFYEKMTPELQTQHEWRDWFSLPFVANPETNAVFAQYFTRQWQDTLLLSFHNFLALVFACLPPPRLADFDSTYAKIQRLKHENKIMRQKLMEQTRALHKLSDGKESLLQVPNLPPPSGDPMDDFFTIAQESQSALASTSGDNQVKALRNFLRNFTGSSSPDKSGGGGSSSKAAKKPSSGKPSKHVPLARVSGLSPSPAKGYAVPDRSKDDRKEAFLLLSQEEYSEHHSEVTQCKFSRSGSFVASADVDGVVKIWSTTPGQPHTVATFISNAGVTCLDWAPHSDALFVYGTTSGSVRLYDQTERKVVSEVATEGTVSQLECSPTGNMLALSSASPKEKLALYDLRTLTKLEHNFNDSLAAAVGASLVVTSCHFNHNSQMLMTGATDGKMRIFDLRRNGCISSWSVSADPILTLRGSKDETSVHALSQAGEFTTWSVVQTSQKLFGATISDPHFNVEEFPRSAWGRQFAFTSDDRHFLACSTNGGVVFEIQTESQTVEKVIGLKGHSKHATCTDWSTSTDCSPCVTAGHDGQIKISTLLIQ